MLERFMYRGERVKILDFSLEKTLAEGIFKGLNEDGSAILEKDDGTLESIYQGRMRSV